MAYTVKQVASLSGVSVRTLHFYDETGLLQPARHAANGYRLYEEPQLLMLQQILFYRELGFSLKQIKHALGRSDYETIGALQSHREVLLENLARTQSLLSTIERTIKHLKGAEEMSAEEMFAGFSVPAGQARFEEKIRLGGEPNDLKVSARDTGGALCVFEFTGSGGGPRHLHHAQDEWIYVLEGEVSLEVADQRKQLGAGESVFLPRNVPHGWVSVGSRPARVLNAYQHAGKMEDFFREIVKCEDGKQLLHEALSFDEMCLLFRNHGMDVVGPPLIGEWSVDESRRIVHRA